jgi:hypothetical protein
MWPTLGEWISENITRVIVRRVIAFLLALVAGVVTSGSAWYLCLLLRDTAVEWFTWAWQTVWKWAKLVAFVIVSVVIGVAFFMEPFYNNDALIDTTIVLATKATQFCYDVAKKLNELRSYFSTINEAIPPGPSVALQTTTRRCEPQDLDKAEPCNRYKGDLELCIDGISIHDLCYSSSQSPPLPGLVLPFGSGYAPAMTVLNLFLRT